MLAGLTADLRPEGPEVEPVPVRVHGRGPWHVRSEEHTTRAATRAAAVSACLTAVNLTAVARTPLLALHTAVVSRGPRTLVLAGPSGRGKTTLTTALLLDGWDYVSDEALALPWTGGAPVPYPRALALSEWSRRALGLPDGVPGQGEHLLVPARLGAGVAPAPAPVTDVVVLEPPGARPQLDPLHRQEALRDLLPRGFTTVQDPGRALVVVADLLRAARTWRLSSGPPRSTAALLSAALA